MAWVNIVRRKEIYRINHTGIYYYGNLITDWAHFYTAYVDDDSSTVSVNDDIKIVLQYYNSEGLLLEQRLPAPYNLDHSFYEIIEAIEVNRNFALNVSINNS